MEQRLTSKSALKVTFRLPSTEQAVSSTSEMRARRTLDCCHHVSRASRITLGLTRSWGRALCDRFRPAQLTSEGPHWVGRFTLSPYTGPVVQNRIAAGNSRPAGLGCAAAIRGTVCRIAYADRSSRTGWWPRMTLTSLIRPSPALDVNEPKLHQNPPLRHRDAATALNPANTPPARNAPANAPPTAACAAAGGVTAERSRRCRWVARRSRPAR